MKKHALYLGLCVAITVFSLAYIYPAFSSVRVFWYYPLTRHWAFEVKPNGLAMDWYGRTLLSTVAGLISFAAAYFALGRWKPSERALKLWAAWAATAVLLAMAVYTFQLVGRHPNPEPLPSWYVPK